MDIYLFFPIRAAVLSYISPIYHTVSLRPNPSLHKSTIDLRRCNDKWNLLSNGQILQMSGAEKKKHFNYILCIYAVVLVVCTSQTVQYIVVPQTDTKIYNNICNNTVNCDSLYIWYKRINSDCFYRKILLINTFLPGARWKDLNHFQVCMFQCEVKLRDCLLIV